MSRKSRDDDRPNDRSDTARRIWLAGLGAYGRAFTEAQGTLARAAGGSSKIFDELVEKGERIESAVETKGRELARKMTAGAPLDERIRRMRARLGLEHDAPGPDIETRLAAIEEKLDRLLAALEPAQARPAAKRRAPARKAKPKST